jgi:hypothetical protein
MKNMSRTFKKADALTRPEHTSTLEKQEIERYKPKPQELAVGGKGDILNRKTNERMKRKVALLAAMNKIHDPDIA